MSRQSSESSGSSSSQDARGTMEETTRQTSGTPLVANARPGSDSPASNKEGSQSSKTDRLKRAVHRLKIVRKATTTGSYQWESPSYAAGEPGIDVRKVDMDEIGSEKVEVRCSDYSVDRFSSCRRSAQDFEEWLAKDRPSWAKVRWIHVNGISWRVLKPLALKYDLHPLAIEDCLNQDKQSRSKSDYYPKHLFLNILFHSLNEHDKRLMKHGSNQSLRSSQNSAKDEDEEDVERQANEFKEQDDGQSILQQLTSDHRIQLQVENLSIFLGKDGTILTIFNRPVKRDLFRPIYDRLSIASTTLRETEDASMLLQAILDLLVDNLLEVTDAFRHQLLHLEAETLADPEMDSLRHLHILSGEFLLLKRALTPLQNVVYHLKRHDAERAIAASEKPASASGTATPQQPMTPHSSFGPMSTGLIPMLGGLSSSSGFLSTQARIYMSDVHDHLDEVISSLELFSSMGENLIGYTFNVANINMNESMKALSLITVIFLPVSVLTGFYGMNLNEIQGPVTDFWRVCAPVVVAMVFIFTWSSMLQTIKRWRRKYLFLKATRNRQKPWRKRLGLS